MNLKKIFIISVTSIIIWISIISITIGIKYVNKDELIIKHTKEVATIVATNLKDNINSYKNKSININSIKFKNADTPLDINTYINIDNSVVHPSILKFEEEFNGYKYWMGITPYSNTNNKYENPCIYVSNDGVKWIEPKGIKNPIQEKPIKGYNADVHIFYDKNDDKLKCIWRERGSGEELNKIGMLESYDGINWGEKKYILKNNSRDFASPCIIQEDGQYKFFSVNLDGGRTTSISLYEGKDLENLKYSKEIYIPGIGDGKQLWHFELRKYDNQYIILYTIATYGRYGSDGKLFLGKSYDLDSWEVNEQPIISNGGWEGNFYKSSFIIDRIGEYRFMKLWYGTTNKGKWNVGYSELMLD